MGCPFRAVTELTLPSGEIVMSSATVPPAPSVFAIVGRNQAIALTENRSRLQPVPFPDVRHSHCSIFVPNPAYK